MELRRHTQKVVPRYSDCSLFWADVSEGFPQSGPPSQVSGKGKAELEGTM